MNDSSWKLLSVQDFLSRYSQDQTDSAASCTKATTLQSNVIWQKRMVQEFFTLFQSPTETASETSGPFNLMLSVQSYFQHFQWNAPLKELESSATEMPLEERLPTFNVQKFSDLF